MGLMLGLVASLFAQQPLDKSMVEFAPGKYIYPQEVSNIDYQEFVARNSYQADLLLDTTAWQTLMAFGDPYVKTYHQHPAFSHYPVLNISREQADAYCAWLTAQYNAHPDRTHQKVVIRLPTEAEWELAASAGQEVDFPWQTNPKKKYQRKSPDGVAGEMLANYHQIDPTRIFRTESGYEVRKGWDKPRGTNYYMVTAPANHGIANGLGLHCMAGNAAEMVQEPGIAKGGSWYHPAGHLRIKERLTYDKALPWLGFRFVMEVLDI